jgi:NAD(P)-dependent dehydrogenase (short-subunit alcohol dehydrogenase family)
MDITRWRQVIDVNLTGPMICAKKVIPFMKREKWGRIINISSAAGLTGEQGFLPYCVSKAGVSVLTRILAFEWSRYNIIVNAIILSPALWLAGRANEWRFRRRSRCSRLVEGR